MVKVFGELSKERLEKFENKYNLRLPTDYLEFLSKNNGGYIENGIFLINEFQKEGNLEVLYGLDIKQRFSNIEYLIDTYPDRFIYNIIPTIARICNPCVKIH